MGHHPQQGTRTPGASRATDRGSAIRCPAQKSENNGEECELPRPLPPLSLQLSWLAVRYPQAAVVTAGRNSRREADSAIGFLAFRREPLMLKGQNTIC